MMKMPAPFEPWAYLSFPGDPFVPPARRYLRSRYLLDHGHTPSVPGDDEKTIQCWVYLRELSHCSDDSQREQLSRCFQPVAGAHRLFTQSQGLERWELEARLLAGQSDDEIATRCQIPAPVIGEFHELFYSVRPFLKATNYIYNIVLGGKCYPNVEPGDNETVLKIFGYAMGGPGVDAVLDYLRNPSVVPSSLDGLDVPDLKRLQSRLRMKIAFLLLTTPASAATPQAWLQLSEKFALLRNESVSQKEGQPAGIEVNRDLISILLEGKTASAGAVEGGCENPAKISSEPGCEHVVPDPTGEAA
jgi:hypothetical protein